MLQNQQMLKKDKQNFTVVKYSFLGYSILYYSLLDLDERNTADIKSFLLAKASPTTQMRRTASMKIEIVYLFDGKCV